MTDTPSLDLKALLPAADGQDLGLRVTLSQALHLEEGFLWTATVEKRRLTRSGKEGKPVPVCTILARKGESPADLMHTLAELYDGDVSVADHQWEAMAEKGRGQCLRALERLSKRE